MTRTLAGRDKKLSSDPNAQITVRDLANGALFTLATGGDTASAERLLNLALSAQDMNTSSPHYGELPWQLNNDDIKDDNAIEFGTQAIGPLFAKYGSSLSPAFKKSFPAHITAAIAAIKRHKVKITYTNIFLMKTVNLILLGEAVGDQSAASEGYSMLDQWIAYTHSNGICEYDSPTYYATDLGSLEMGYLFARKPEGRTKFKDCLDTFWTDISANFFAERGVLSGPHSRDYDFLLGTGGINVVFYLEGLRNQLNPKEVDLEKVFALIGQGETGYHPSPQILAISKQPERVVQQRWSSDSSKDRYNYITDAFAIGSANGDYGPQDKVINIELSDERVPNITIVSDNTDHPFGKNKTKDKSGHSKPKHIPSRPLVLQSKGTLIAMLDLDASKESQSQSLSTNVLLPAKAHELLVDGQKISITDNFKAILNRRSTTIAVSSGDTVLAFKVFAADGSGGQGAQLMLKADDESLRLGVVRLAIYHHQGKSLDPLEKNVRVGLLFKIKKCASEEKLREFIQTLDQTKVSSATINNLWTVSAQVDSDLLEASYDLNSHRATVRRINGKDIKMPVFSVNGIGPQH